MYNIDVIVGTMVAHRTIWPVGNGDAYLQISQNSHASKSSVLPKSSCTQNFRQKTRGESAPAPTTQQPAGYENPSGPICNAFAYSPTAMSIFSQANHRNPIRPHPYASVKNGQPRNYAKGIDILIHQNYCGASYCSIIRFSTLSCPSATYVATHRPTSLPFDHVWNQISINQLTPGTINVLTLLSPTSQVCSVLTRDRRHLTALKDTI